MSIKIYFGVPGSGKTTLAAKIVMENLKKGVLTYSNVPIKGSLLYDASQIGSIDISGGEMVIDEASIQFNNRKFKTLPQQTIEWFKLSRHYGIKNIHVFSQSYDDMDITLRRLADEIYVVKRSLLPFTFVIRRIKVKVGIDQDTHQIMDQYFFQFLGIKPYLGYHYWHMFDSWDAPDLPRVSWYYSSFDDYTIDPKHSKIIYRSLHKQGKIRYKFVQWCRRVFSRKNITEKSARIVNRFLGLSRKLKHLPERARRSKSSRQASGVKIDPPIPSGPDDEAAFVAFFQRKEAAVDTSRKEKKINLSSLSRKTAPQDKADE